jgi:gas vesicle protein
MIAFLIGLLIGAIGGFIAGVKNAKSAKVEKAVDILKALKGK